MGFNFTALNECETCGRALENSNDNCPRCSEGEVVTAVFRYLNSEKTWEFETSTAVDVDKLFENMAERLTDEDVDPLGLVWLGHRGSVDALLKHNETVADISPYAMTTDYNGDEDLQELANYDG